ncbi:annexin B9-like [Chelonus insularis]|uniref:annexin B9-like n=1 Tax=Chelonus insularis TaxID=460826 RepID=UPI0015895B7E|nr:annexin B9-like [Chelonus insularis]
MKAHQLFLLTFWLVNGSLVLGATWEIDFSPLKGYYNSFNIIPSPYYRKEDVEEIHKALKSVIPNEIKIVEILARLKSQDRQLLAQEYQRAYGTRLVNDLRNKLTGKLEETVVAIMTPIDQFLAQEIHDAIYGFHSDETALIDTLCLFNTTMLDKVRNMYGLLYDTNMDYEIRVNAAGSFGKLMISCVHNMRTNKISIDDYATKLSNGFTDDDFISYFALTSLEEIHQMRMKHKPWYGRKLEDIIKENSSGDFRRALMAILNYAMSEKLYFLKRFHDSLERHCVDHRSLIRLILMGKKVRYEGIRDIYQKKYHKNIDEVLSNKLPPGNYRKLIQALFIRM